MVRRPGFARLLGSLPRYSAHTRRRLDGAGRSDRHGWAAGRILPNTNRAAYRLYSIATVLTLLANLVIGQVPFLLGAAFGLGALLTIGRQRRPLCTVLLATACTLCSPLAAAFLLLTGLALIRSVGRRRVAPLAGALTGLAVAAVVGAGGPFPCPWSSLVGVLAFCVVAYAVSSHEDQLLRRFAALYAVAAVMTFMVPNPIGGNITRLGKLIALPLAAYLLTRPRNRRLIVGIGGVQVTFSTTPSSTSR